MSHWISQPITDDEVISRITASAVFAILEAVTEGHLNKEDLGTLVGPHEVDPDGHGFQFHYAFGEVVEVLAPFHNGVVVCFVNRDFVTEAVEFVRMEFGVNA
jgi:hypothetical protein